MKRLKRDSKALEGFPLRLLIISIVLAITIPVVYSSWEYYDTRKVLQNIEGEVEFLGQKAESVFIYGPGAQEKITVNLEDGVFVNIRFVEIGGKDSPGMIRWKVGDKYEGDYLMPRNISLLSYGEEGYGERIILDSGTHDLILKCESGEIRGTETRFINVTAS